MKQFLACFLLFFLTSLSAQAESIHVQDGDIFLLGRQSVRLWGIDAPEYDQTCDKDGEHIPCGDISEEVLRNFIGKTKPDCKRLNTDKLNRWIAQCSVNGQDLGALMVHSGWAVDYRYYSKGAYAKEEQAAKSERRGLWGTRFEWPWDYRHKKYP